MRTPIVFTGLALITGAALLNGCGAGMPCCFDDLYGVRWQWLPDDHDRLVATSEASYKEAGPASENQASLAAACKALRMESNDAHAAHLGARACFWLSDHGDAADWMYSDCVRFSEIAVAGAPRNPEYHYLLALNLGILLQHAGLKKALTNLGRLIDELETVLSLDEAIDQGGALRVLGLLYLRAPAWPTGPGDEEKALDLLKRAASHYSNHPMNHLALAEAWLADESFDEALEALDRVRAMADPTVFLWRAERWRREADALEQKIRRAMSGN
jgi:tetratricopeptide (TPR) repeat protein